MKRPVTRRTIAGALALLCVAAASIGLVSLFAQESEPKIADMVVHEWGTFLAMNGSDGTALDGMYHEEHSLPGFVHARSRDQLRIPSVSLKGETPVIYFYTDKPQTTRVEVKFPQGIWTQWYPQAQIVGPQFTQAPNPTELKNGVIRWRAEIIPANTPDISLPKTSADALWNYAREVDAAYVRTSDFTKENNPTETERYIFYRGLGKANLPLSFTATEGGQLSLPCKGVYGVAHLFVIKVEGDKAAYTYYPSLKPGDNLTQVIPTDASAKPLAEFTTNLSNDLAARLVESGLYEKEARAMVNTWRSSYFQTPGVRVLFVMPQEWTDGFIPLKITPKPKQTVRVMVGRTELLMPERERAAEDAINQLASTDEKTRQAAFKFLQDQGRYVEPIIRRVMAATTDEKTKSLCKKLLSTELVTELKSALQHVAETQGRLQESTLYTRAQLAYLLREVGQTEAAKAEAKSVLDELAKASVPAFSDPDFRGHIRAQAKATEAAGDLQGAANTYSEFVAFGAQALSQQNCRACHRDGGPEQAAWFRTWWAGPRYASHVAKTEGLTQAIARLRQEKANPTNDLKLAYLLEAKGDKSAAEALWKQVEKGALPPGAANVAGK